MKSASQVPISYLLPDWLRSPTLPLLAGNELRAIFPIFFSGAAVILLSGLVSEDFRQGAALFGYGFGCIALTSVAFGHDFTHGTLLLTLSQPVAREQLWALRLRISTIAITALVIAACLALQIPQLLWRTVFYFQIAPIRIALLLIPPLAAICVAPWFTLLCRSALAGTVFTVSLPFALLLMSEWFTSAITPHVGLAHLSPSVITLCLFSLSFGIACVTGFIATRMRFQSLEAIDRSGATFNGFSGSRFKTGASAIVRRDRRSSVWGQLAWKELRIQAITLVPTFGMLLTAYSVRKPGWGNSLAEILALATSLWAIAICVIIGAVGSAEERQLGTIESQALLPVSKSNQWLLKAALLVLLAQLIAVNLPLWILRLSPDVGHLPLAEPKWWSIAAISLVSLSLYISSCCRTTMKAILLSHPFAAIFLFLISLMYGNEHEILKPSASFYPLETRVLPNAFSFTDILFAPIIDAQRLALFAPYLCLTIVLFHLLRSACINHFSAEAGSRWLRQAGWLTGLTLASLIFCLSFSLRAGIF